MTAVWVVTMLGTLHGGTPYTPAPGDGPAGAISGMVTGAGGQPVSGAVVVVCEQAGGIPLSRGTLQPFIQDRAHAMGDDILFSLTGADGRFTFEKLPIGVYRAVAQSWKNKTTVRVLLEVNGEEVELHGVANDIRVAEGATADVVLRPLGTGALRMDQQVPNDETLLILSTAPPSADPVLGFVSWTGPFLRQAIGCNRMPGGRTVVHGLPEGRLHVAMFAADNVPGFLDAQVQIRPGQTTLLPCTPFVAGWSDGRHDPPPELVPIYDEIKALPRAESQRWFMKALAAAGVPVDPQKGPHVSGHLDTEIVLPSGRKATAGQALAAAGYVQLQASVARRTGRDPAARSGQPAPAAPRSAAPPSELQRRIDAAQPGATLTVPQGTHTSPVRIGKPLTLKGSSPQECILEVTPHGPALFVETGGQGEVSLEGLTIKWQLAEGATAVEQPVALAVKDTKVSVRHCRFVPLGDLPRTPMAIRIEGRSHATISDCRFEGFDFAINYGLGTEGLVEDCFLRDGGHQGVTGYDRSTLRVERTIVSGFKYHALRCTGGTLHAKDNLLLNNRVSGICLGNKDGQGSITNTLMIGNGEGIAAFYQARFEVHNNVILDATTAGIGAWDTCHLNISNNIFQGNAKALVIYPQGAQNTNTIGANTFWRNTVDTENCRRTHDSLLADPLFQAPGTGDYSLHPGPSLDRHHGLTDPQVIRQLLDRWKTETQASTEP
ncbi:MAG: right-handed parallel beta-helix repeat-containing protein [Planctomycetes bacterium]|jgi:hypothetical protein|nr:right-handed parallel beta-helix repeat-containing protein [Planctomycetota bacterium]